MKTKMTKALSVILVIIMVASAAPVSVALATEGYFYEMMGSPIIAEETILMYAPDGRTANVEQSKVSAWQAVGWSLEPPMVYFLGKTMSEVISTYGNSYTDGGYYESVYYDGNHYYFLWDKNPNYNGAYQIIIMDYDPKYGFGLFD